MQKTALMRIGVVVAATALAACALAGCSSSTSSSAASDSAKSPSASSAAVSTNVSNAPANVNVSNPSDTSANDNASSASSAPANANASSSASAATPSSSAASSAAENTVSGEVVTTTYAERAKEVSYAGKEFDDDKQILTLLVLDKPITVDAQKGGGAWTGEVSVIKLPNDELYRRHSGKVIKLAVKSWGEAPADVAGFLYDLVLDTDADGVEIVDPLD